jgi:hypothetical protein
MRVVDKFLIFSTTTERGHNERMALESMRIVTGCKTPAQFVAVFQRFCDAKTCFIPSIDTRPVGSALAFSLRLADGTPMLRGTCIVKAAWKTNENQFKRPGVQLEIKKLSAESAALYDQMLSQKTGVRPRPDGVVQPIDDPTTNQHVPQHKAIDLILRQGNAPRVPMKPPPIPDAAKRTKTAQSDDDNPTQPVVVDPTQPVPVVRNADAMATVEMPVVQVSQLQRAIAEGRAPGSAEILPANPLSDFDDNALDALLGCTLTEDADSSHDDLAIPVDEPMPLPPIPVTIMPRKTTKMKAKAKAKVKTAPLPVVLRDDAVPIPIPVYARGGGTRPLALETRPPASRSMVNLHAMTNDERFWFLCALGAVLLVAAIVLASAFFAG